MKKDPAEIAANAHTDLNTFGTIVTILEGGHLYCNESQSTAARIIKMCQAQQQYLLRLYDRSIEAGRR
ncbi:hypothetical protein [Rhizobium rhizogenes]|uniref:hypothetical protein n=1 Tax=Rhizobium rhizogenes TaxID=359 RepID=UPI001571A57A|nr:hypothetical protein [Rhizobium rhizogenes]NTF67728.1 hypothetical protein [Rhizobium rhizogenes]